MHRSIRWQVVAASRHQYWAAKAIVERFGDLVVEESDEKMTAALSIWQRDAAPSGE